MLGFKAEWDRYMRLNMLSRRDYMLRTGQLIKADTRDRYGRTSDRDWQRAKRASDKAGITIRTDANKRPN